MFIVLRDIDGTVSSMIADTEEAAHKSIVLMLQEMLKDDATDFDESEKSRVKALLEENTPVPAIMSAVSLITEMQISFLIQESEIYTEKKIDFLTGASKTYEVEPVIIDGALPQQGDVKDLPGYRRGNYVNFPHVRCCEEWLPCPNFTNTCDHCGADYNGSGQRLQPRRLWGEETGEHYTDCI